MDSAPQLTSYADSDLKLSLSVIKNFYDKASSVEIFRKLESNVVYNPPEKIKIFGKLFDMPRKQTAFGDPGTSYKFSGIEVPSKPWIPIISEIKERIELITGESFNFCLVNRYANGKDYIGYHKDDEKDLVKTTSIASMSFGTTRKFYLKPDDSSANDIRLNLYPGTLCMIEYPTNLHYKHSVPKELKIHNPRVNLTFRSIKVVT